MKAEFIKKNKRIVNTVREVVQFNGIYNPDRYRQYRDTFNNRNKRIVKRIEL